MRYLAKALSLAGAIGVAAAGVAIVWAAPLITLLFGAEFAGAAGILRVLALVIVFRGISTVALYAANALGQSRHIATIAIAFTIANVTANLVLLPRFGAYAAAWISGVGEVALASALVMVSVTHIRASRAVEALEVVADARD